MQKPYLKCLLLVWIAYVCAYGGLLLWTGGLPYVLDNNESFSSLWHAYNLYHFDVRQTCGITDEACSPDPAAHPYVYTHQGNFPRLFAFLLFVLGARGIESQVVFTTLTVGTVSVLFAYHFFSGLAGPRFGLLACLVLMTDYVLFAQWQVVTYRVWHSFFLFSSLLCAQGAARVGGRVWAALTFLNFLCLFYFECVFVVFVTLASALHTAAVHWRAPRAVGRAAAPAAAGACVAVLAFAVQLVGCIGLRGALTDASFTPRARNHAGADMATRAMLDFYDRHAIVFWHNFVDGKPFLRPRAFCRSFLTYNLGPYTPLFALIVLATLGGLLAALLLHGARSPAARALLRRLAPTVLPNRALAPQVRLALGLGAFLFLSFCADRFLVAVLRDHAFVGYKPEELSPLDGWRLRRWVAAAAAGAFILLVSRSATNRWWGFARVSPARVAAAGCALLAAAQLVRRQPEWYDQDYQAFWTAVRDTWFVRGAGRLSVLFAAGLAAVLALGGCRLLGRRNCEHVGRLARYLACGGAAYLAVYVLFPGYLHSGYLERYVSFFVFFTNVLIAVTLYFLFQLLRRDLSRRARVRTALARPPHALPGRLAPGTPPAPAPLGAPAPSVVRALAAGLLLVFLAAYWVRLQVICVRAFPPDAFAFLKVLREPPFRGASFAANVYAPPVAASTGQWAYHDPSIAAGRVQLGRTGYLVERDMHSYLWLKDKASNPAYARPDYILLVAPPSLKDLPRRLLPGRPLPADLPESQPIVARPQYLHHRIAARDPSGRGRWLILKADWDYPPYLVPLAPEDPLSRVRLDVDGGPDYPEARVRYRYAQQEGKPESGTIVRLYTVGPDGEPHLLAQQKGEGVFRLPRSFAGNLRASVTPSTATKQGPEFFSDTRRVGNVPSARAPYLKPLPGPAGDCFVRPFPATGSQGDVIRVEYAYAHDENEPEAGTLRRLYLEDEFGQLTLVREARGCEELRVPMPAEVDDLARARFRVSVTPRSARAVGREYFSRERIPGAYFYRPFLRPLAGPDASRILVEVRPEKTYIALRVQYTFGHPFCAVERGSRVRVYRVDLQGSLTLLREEQDARVVLLEPDFRGTVRVSVAPAVGGFPGPEYFSDPVVIGD